MRAETETAIHHPSLDHLVDHATDPAVTAHLATCAPCGVQTRMLDRVLIVDPASLPRIEEARVRLANAQRDASVSLSQSFGNADDTDELAADHVVDGRYTVEAVLGRGGMGTVYRVRHNELGSVHALKVLHWASPAIRERLIREGRAQGGLRHPNVVPVTDVVNVGGAPGLILDLVDGPPLSDWLRRERPSIAVADRIAQGVIRGVGAAHAAGFIHRDLKPANVLLAAGDEGLVPKVTDFGLVRVITEASDQRLTRADTPMGTPAYMAPEQLRDASQADVRSDVFSLGALLYELVTGRRAFAGADWLDVCDRIRAGHYDPLGADVPARMAVTIERCLEVEPADRPADCAAVLAAWTTTAPTGTPRARHRVPPGSGSPKVRAGRVVAALGVAAVVLSIGGVATGWFGHAAFVAEPERTPFVSSNELAQRRFESAWSSFLLGDFAAARDDLGGFAPEELLPQVLLAAALDFQGHTGRAYVVLDRALPHATDPNDPTATLIRLYEESIYPQGRTDGWAAFLAEHPDDFLAHVIAAHATSEYRGEQEAAYDRARVLAPPGAERLFRLIDNRAATRPARRATSIGGPSRSGSYFAGVMDGAPTLWRNADILEKLVTTFADVVAGAPADADLRSTYAIMLGHTGDLAGREAQLAVLFYPEIDRLDRLRVALPQGWYEFGIGRWDAAQVILQGCETDASAPTIPAPAWPEAWSEPFLPEAVLCADTRLEMALMVGDVAAAKSAREALAGWVARPEVPTEMSRRMGAGLVWFDARIALLEGDTAGARAGYEDLVDSAPEYVRWETGEEAALELNAAIRERDEPWVARAYHEERRNRGCRWEVAYGRTIIGSGDAEKGVSALRDAAGGAMPCDGGPLVNEFYRAESRILWAETLADQGDLDGAKVALADFHARWPRPDADHPFVARADALEKRLGATP